jgi:hypothetical protein
VLLYRWTLAGIHHSRATMLIGLKRWPEARAAITQELLGFRDLARDFPTRADFRRYRDGCRDRFAKLAVQLLDEGEHVEAARAAETLARIFAGQGQEYVRAASVLGRCAGLAGTDMKLPEAKRRALARDYGDRAMRCLSGAVAFGLSDPDALRGDEFRALADRADFQRLLDGLRKEK